MTPSPPSSKHWVHDWDPFLIQFPESFPVEGIRWYGFAYVLGFVTAAVLLNLYFKKGRSPLNKEAQTNLLTYIILGTIVGGRLGYMFLYNFNELISSPLSIFQVWKGGMASHGGFLGICIALILFARSQKMSFWKLSDIVVTLGPPGLIFGRIANFINGELWGKVSDVPWAVIFPIKNSQMEIIDYTLPCHPSQLYQAGLEGLCLTIYIQVRFWFSSTTQKISGHLTGEFLIAYALLRILGEIFREPDEFVSLLFGLSRGTFYSIIMMGAGVAIICFLRMRNKPLESVSQ